MGTALRGFGRALGLLLALQLLLPASPTQAATLPGTAIPNVATLSFDVGGVIQPPEDSNIVRFNVRSPATIEFLTYAPSLPGAELVPVPNTEFNDGSNFQFIPAPPETASQPVLLTPAELFHVGTPFYLRLTDLDQNIDPTTVQTVLVTITCVETGDTEVLRLTESGLNTGIFTGYLPSVGTGSATPDGTLLITTDSHITASYTDATDGTDSAVDAALVDPYGILYDSTTGEPLDGATVTLIDLATNLPATTIVGDNGAPGFPASVITGSTFDYGGVTYNNPAGGYRFPFVPPGSYRLLVSQVDGYVMPSGVSDSDLQSRSWWNSSGYIAAEGSRGEGFAINPGPAIRIDIPADPLSSYLWLQKKVNYDKASTGDFLQYTLELENGNALLTSPDVSIIDRLPLGFRYQSGSTRISGSRAADPSISKDGRTLTFKVGDVAPGANLNMSYVVELTVGIKIGKAINTAQATDSNNISSNVARATVDVREAFFRDQAILVGRILEGACSEDDTEMKGVQGVRVYLEDGTYVVTDKDGKYHFEGVEPGMHVVQVDTMTLPNGYEMIPCEESSQFAGRTFSQFVDLRGGTIWRVNFYTAPKAPPAGEVSLKLSTTLEGNIATLKATASAKAVAVENLRLTIMLPGSAEYISGSARHDGEKLADPFVMGGAVNLRSQHLEAGNESEYIIQARLNPAANDDELPTKALLTFDSPSSKNQRTPLAENSFRLSPGVSQPSEEIRLYPRFPSFVAELQETDLSMLEQLATRLEGLPIVRIEIIGHTDNKKISSRSKHIFANNQALSEKRAQSVADILRQRLNLPENVVTQRGLGETMPVADNSTEAGRALNRRVDVNIVTAEVNQPPKVELVETSSPPQSVATAGATAIAAKKKSTRMVPPVTAQPPQVTPQWLAELKPETGIIWPAAGAAPPLSATGVVIQHPRGSQVVLSLNGEQVNAFNFDTTKPVPNSDFMISSWEAVNLHKGLNRIEATINTSDETPPITLKQELWYVTTVEKIEWLEEKSTLLADGIQPPTFVVRLTDSDGHPVRPGQEVTFQVTAPYQALHDDRYEDINRSANFGTLVTGADGFAYIQLEPTTKIGEVTVSVTSSEGPQEISTWLKPVSREWILVGFAEGTMGHNTFSGNSVNLEEAGIDEHSYDDGQMKFFAKGAIKGEWLMTMAYDSDKPNLDGDSLYQIIDPDTYYPLYGDGTNQGYEASSAHKVYVKLEKKQFYALFGDMHSGLTQTELSRYDRNMSGFKSELQKHNFSYTMFAAETKQAFIKDEIRGDGTSGRYYLSQKELVINSEQVTLETRDRFRSDVITETQTLQRHIDYDIDYDAGSLFFKRPVPSKDKNFDPVFIVVRYETLDSDDENLNYGGRAAVKVLNQKVEIGASYIHEERGAGEGDLYGADATVKLTPQTTLQLEAARTDNKFLDEEEKDDAYLAELSHDGNRLKTRAYFREQGKAFGLGQQNLSESGTRKYGAEAVYQFNPKVSLASLIYREELLASDNQRDVAELDARYQAQRFGLNGGLRHAEDSLGDGQTKRSEQVLVGGNWFSADAKLKLRVEHEQAINNRNKNVDYPTRTILGADYQINPWVSAFAEQEFTWGDEEDTEGTRLGLNATPWKGGNVSTTVERQMAENSQRVFAIFGLGQTWRISEKWSVDAALDRSYTIKSEDDYQFNEKVPTAQGSDDDFTSVSVGSTYRKAKWTWWNRLETRQGDNEDKYGASTSVVGEPKDGVAVSAKALAFISKVSGGVRQTDGNIRLGAAYRPTASRWIILNRLDFYFDKLDNSDNDYDNWRIVNHIHANFRVNRKLQMSFYYGLKYVHDNYDGSSYRSFTDMLAFESRYNITKRWDIGVHGSVLHSWNGGQYNYSFGADLGYSPMTNTWVSLGYNVVGFEDNDFSAAHYTAQGAYMRIRAKFDQESVKDAAQWLNR
jgi:uncharacterized repeat protein (TIGR01451 family)